MTRYYMAHFIGGPQAGIVKPVLTAPVAMQLPAFESRGTGRATERRYGRWLYRRVSDADDVSPIYHYDGVAWGEWTRVGGAGKP